MPGPQGPHHLPLAASTFVWFCSKNICLDLQQTSLVNFSTFFRCRLILAFSCHKRVYTEVG